jgi:hydrogenase expression/formation protein HypE
MSPEHDSGLGCPAPHPDSERILLAHGGGGRLMRRLIDELFAKAFRNPDLQTTHDAAVLAPTEGRLAFSTDSFVVQPLFFPGGDIGSLAVTGTVNDLAMAGARPLCLSVGFILEEGLLRDDLRRVVDSMRRAADSAAVRIVTGDTKVVERGRCDGVYVNTAGIGIVPVGIEIGPQRVRPGDVILLNGDLGRHGIAVLAARSDLKLRGDITSDCAPLAACVQALTSAGVRLHCLRDLTRGGLATALLEIAASAGLHIQIDEEAIAVRSDVGAACELLGYDPLYVANEGRFVTILPAQEAPLAAKIIAADRASSGCQVIGKVHSGPGPGVSLKTPLGAERVLTMLTGEQLPRIC